MTLSVFPLWLGIVGLLSVGIVIGFVVAMVKVYSVPLRPRIVNGKKRVEGVPPPEELWVKPK